MDLKCKVQDKIDDMQMISDALEPAFTIIAVVFKQDFACTYAENPLFTNIMNKHGY